MKRYVVIFEDSAQADVRESYDWGCRAWGKRKAQQWVRQLRTAVSKQLRVLPKMRKEEFAAEHSPPEIHAH